MLYVKRETEIYHDYSENQCNGKFSDLEVTSSEIFSLNIHYFCQNFQFQTIFSLHQSTVEQLFPKSIDTDSESGNESECT